jgi:pimeloyl-ACP methyl ester carboxylesterase
MTFSTDTTDLSLTLSDGRTLGYALYGDPEGRPVLYFTGGNSSRYEGSWFADEALRQGLMVVVPDRPGFGLSDARAGRTLLDWGADVAEIADALGIGDLRVFGLSGGGPHVAAACVALGGRISRAAIVSGVAPPEMPGRFRGMWPPLRFLFFASRRWPALSRVALRQMGSFYADEEQMLKRMRQALPAPDVALIDARPDVIATFSRSAREAHRHGIDGDAQEWQLYVHPWGFRLEAVEQPVDLWYGTADINVPSGMGRYLASRLPNSTLHEVDGGHFSTINNHIEAILRHLLA